MDARIEKITKNGSEFLIDYTDGLLGAAGRFTERVLTDVARLTCGVIEEGAKVALAATEVFLPEDEDSKS